MKEYRCKFCHKLLFKQTIKLAKDLINRENITCINFTKGRYGLPFLLIKFEIKCPKCKQINWFEIEEYDVVKDIKRAKIFNNAFSEAPKLETTIF